MKTGQQQQAEHLYFQTDLNKSQIAEAVGIGRRNIHHWIRQNNWDRLKKSGEFIPSFLAENCYQVLGNLTEHLLSEDRVGKPATLQEVNAMYKLITGISKLKNRSTLSETIETLAWFTESVIRKDVRLAQQMQPHIADYLAALTAQNTKKYRPAKLEKNGFIPSKPSAETEAEAKLDEEDFLAWAEEEAKREAESADKAGQPGSVASGTSAASQTTGSVAQAIPSSVAQKPPKVDLRKMLRGTASKGPSTVLRKNKPAA